MGWSDVANKNLMKHQKRNEEIHRKAMFRLAAQTDLKSPVDSGRFRSNWVGAYGSIDRETTEQTNVDSVGKVVSLLAIEPVKGNYFYYTNSLPYAQRLEYGWSLQAPSGVVRLTSRNFPRYVREEIARTKL